MTSIYKEELAEGIKNNQRIVFIIFPRDKDKRFVGNCSSVDELNNSYSVSKGILKSIIESIDDIHFQEFADSKELGIGLLIGASLSECEERFNHNNQQPIMIIDWISLDNYLRIDAEFFQSFDFVFFQSFKKWNPNKQDADNILGFINTIHKDLLETLRDSKKSKSNINFWSFLEITQFKESRLFPLSKISINMTFSKALNRYNSNLRRTSPLSPFKEFFENLDHSFILYIISIISLTILITLGISNHFFESVAGFEAVKDVLIVGIIYMFFVIGAMFVKLDPQYLPTEKVAIIIGFLKILFKINKTFILDLVENLTQQLIIGLILEVLMISSFLWASNLSINTYFNQFFTYEVLPILGEKAGVKNVTGKILYFEFIKAINRNENNENHLGSEAFTIKNLTPEYTALIEIREMGNNNSIKEINILNCKLEDNKYFLIPPDRQCYVYIVFKRGVEDFINLPLEITIRKIINLDNTYEKTGSAY